MNFDDDPGDCDDDSIIVFPLPGDFTGQMRLDEATRHIVEAFAVPPELMGLRCSSNYAAAMGMLKG